MTSHENLSTSRNPAKTPRFKSVEEFNIIEKIGSGGYSYVMLVQNKKSGKKYALKCAAKFKKGKDRSSRTRTEIQVLEKLKHKNIIQLKGHFEDSEMIYLVLQYIPGRDCSKFFKHKLPSKLQTKSMMRQMIEAVTYLHKKGIVHRDIKLENILVDKHYNIKMIDFGLSAIKETEFDILHDTLGTLRYTAPELIKGEGYNESVDIWGLGVIFFMLLTGEFPFNGSSKTSIFRRIQEKTLHFSKYDLDKKEVYLLKSMLTKDPEKRIEIDDILSDPFFK